MTAGRTRRVSYDRSFVCFLVPDAIVAILDGGIVTHGSHEDLMRFNDQRRH
jgi:hypothetical protein